MRHKPFPGSPDDMMNTIAALRARNEVLEAGERHWNGVYKIILDERDALRARVAKLEAALKHARGVIEIIMSDGNCDCQKDFAIIDAALKDAPQGE